MLSQPGSAGGEIPPRPWLLGLSEQMKEFGALWAVGGIEDQPHYLWGDLRIVSDTIRSFQTVNGEQAR